MSAIQGTCRIREVSDPRAAGTVLSNDLIAQLVEYTDPLGLRVAAAETEWYGATAAAECPIETPEGKTHGALELILRDSATGPIAYIEQLSLAEPSRSHGFGRRWLSRFEQACTDSGIITLELWARDVGGYFWASAGFEFRTPHPDQREQVTEEPVPPEMTSASAAQQSSQEWLAADWFAVNRVDERLAATVAEHAELDPIAQAFRGALPTLDVLRSGGAADLRTPAQIAGFGRDAAWTERGVRMWLGKKLMASSDWWGVKQLTAGQ